MNLWHRFFFSPVDYVKELKRKESKMNRLKYPIVYTPDYNISLWGLEKIHPFDCQTYRKVFEGLIKKGVIIDKTSIHVPTYVSRANLRRVYIFLQTKRLGSFDDLSLES
jgi:histone deacetylase 11